VATQAVLREEIAEHQKAIARINDEIKALQSFIAADERNVQHSVEAIRVNAQLSLGNYRNSLAQKQTELQDLQQVMQRKLSIVTKMEEVARKEQEVQRLEVEKDRIINLHEKARADLDRLAAELDAMARPEVVPQGVLIMASGERVALPMHETELLIGCKDVAAGIYPTIDLTPFGGTASGASRKHATLRLRSGAWTITDENSTNGTFVDGSRIAAYVPKVLVNGTRLRFGAVEATFASATTAPAGKTVRLA
jgi:hypothetical protein